MKTIAQKGIISDKSLVLDMFKKPTYRARDKQEIQAQNLHTTLHVLNTGNKNYVTILSSDDQDSYNKHIIKYLNYDWKDTSNSNTI